MRKSNFALRLHSQLGEVIADPDGPLEVFARLADDLAKLERYERRALSRRNRALQALIS